MRCRKLISYTALVAGITLAAPAVFALPTDLGRSADVYANAVRVNTAASYLVNRTIFVPHPQEEVVVAEVLPAQDAPPKFAAPIVFDAALAVSLRGLAPLTQVASVVEEVVEAPVAEVLASVEPTQAPAVAIEDSADADPVAVASTPDSDVTETPAEPVQVADIADAPAYVDDQTIEPAVVSDVATAFEAPGVEDDITLAVALAEQANVRLRYDEAFGIPLVAVALDSFDVPPVQSYGIDEIIPASVQWDEVLPEAAVASSRRPVAATNPERLLSAMADADDNLVIRDGGEDGPDTMMMSSDVLFSFGDAKLSEEAMETLASIGDMSDNVPIIEVLGHTDAIGQEDDNLTLGQQRAEAVRAWLLENSDFTEDRVIATGVGEVDPVADNVTTGGLDNPDGRAQNRRVEFAFLTETGEVEELTEASFEEAATE